MAWNLLKDLPGAFGGSLPEIILALKTLWENVKRLNLIFQPTHYTSLIAAGRALANLVSDIGSQTATLYVNSTVTVAANLTIPSNISLVVLKGGSFAISTGVTLTISGPFHADEFQVFTLAGSAAVRGLKYINAKWFCLGDGSTNDTTPFIRMCDCLQNAGGGWLHFPYGDYRIFGGTSGSLTTLGAFSSLTSGIRLTSDGATLTNTRTFSNNEYGEIFRFTGCHNIEIGDFTLNTTTTLPDTPATHKTRGVDFAAFYANAGQGGCRNIKGGLLKARGIRIGYVFYRTSSDPLSYAARNITIAGIDTDFCAYGLSCQFSGFNLTAKIKSVDPHRSYSVYGVEDHWVQIQSQGQDANDAFVGAFEGYGCKNINVWYSNADALSSPAAEQAAPGASLYFGDQTPAVHRNIHFHFNIKWNTSSGYFGAGLEVYKHNNAGSYDTVDRGHTIDGLEITGHFEGNPGPSNSPPILTGGTWGAGEFVRNVWIHDVRCNDTASSTLSFLNSLDGPCTIENVHSTANWFLGENAAGTRIVCINVRAPNLTAATSHAGHHSYYACEITDASSQSIINKSFYGKTRVLSVLQPNAQEVAGVRSLTNESSAKFFASDASGGSAVDSQDVSFDGRVNASTGNVARNVLIGTANVGHATNQADLQAVLSSANSSTILSIALALLRDGSLSLRSQTGAVTANTLLSTEILNLTAALIKLVDAQNIQLGTGTGTQMGTAAAQKLALWGKTPIVQPAHANQTAVAAQTQDALTDSTTGTADTTLQDVGAAFSQATLNNNFADLAAQLAKIRADIANIKTFQDQNRTDQVAVGVIKGSA